MLIGFGVRAGLLSADYPGWSRFAEQFEQIELRLSPYKSWFIIFLVIAVVLYLVYKFLRNPIPTGDPSEVPIIGTRIAAVMPAPTPEQIAATAPGEAALSEQE